jgi:hypothetical protein
MRQASIWRFFPDFALPGHFGAIVDIPNKGRMSVMKNIPLRWHVIPADRRALCRSAAKANKGADQVLPVAASSISNNPLTKLTLIGFAANERNEPSL